jgi:hypothetical protein
VGNRKGMARNGADSQYHHPGRWPIGAVAWTVWEGTNQDRDPGRLHCQHSRDAGTVALNWAAGMGYIGSGDVVPLMALSVLSSPT